jgi:hypothetical protein
VDIRLDVPDLASLVHHAVADDAVAVADDAHSEDSSATTTDWQERGLLDELVCQFGIPLTVFSLRAG